MKINELVQTHIKPLLAKGLDSSLRFNSISVGILTSKDSYFFNFKDESKQETKLPDQHTIYEIGSITKVFTGILLADAVLNNPNISLDTPIHKLLSESVKLEYQGKYITIRNLVNHTSGLPKLPTNFNPKNPMNPYADYTEAKLKDFLSTYKLERMPGESVEYSNVGFGLLGYLLTDKENPTYEHLIQNKITSKLGLKDTTITLTPDQQKRFRIGFLNGKPTPPWDIDILAGAGALKSTASDLIKFIKSNIDASKTPLEDQLNLAQSNVIFTSKDGNKTNHSLGWQNNDNGYTKSKYHTGMTYGASSFIAFDPVKRIGIVFLSNNAFFSEQSIDRRFEKSAARVYDSLYRL